MHAVIVRRHPTFHLSAERITTERDLLINPYKRHLTNTEKLNIRTARAGGVAVKELAEYYHVNTSTIYRTVNEATRKRNNKH